MIKYKCTHQSIKAKQFSNPTFLVHILEYLCNSILQCIIFLIWFVISIA